MRNRLFVRVLALFCSLCSIGFAIADDGPVGPPISLICYVDSNDCVRATSAYAAETGLFEVTCGSCVTVDGESRCVRNGYNARVADSTKTINFALPYPQGPGQSGRKTVNYGESKECGMEVRCLQGCYENEDGDLICERENYYPYILPSRVAAGQVCTAATGS